jgi:hypothetical protein
MGGASSTTPQAQPAQQIAKPKYEPPRLKKARQRAQKQAEAKAQSKLASQSNDMPTSTEGSSTVVVSKAQAGATVVVKASAKYPKDKNHAPSKESGGVPEPTMPYFLRSQAPSVPLTVPRRILVVMDLNGTLLHRPHKKRPFHFVERPHAKAFLNYCLDNFVVAIWSSARPVNVEKMVERLLTPEQVKKCILVWGRDKFGLSDADYDGRVQCYKRLTRIWSAPEIMAAHPEAEQGGQWDQTNTILVDDSREKARSEPHNLIQIHDFTGLASEPPHVLPQVHDYINSLCLQSNISSFIRENPFRLDPEYKLAI